MLHCRLKEGHSESRIIGTGRAANAAVPSSSQHCSAKDKTRAFAAHAWSTVRKRLSVIFLMFSMKVDAVLGCVIDEKREGKKSDSTCACRYTGQLRSNDVCTRLDRPVTWLQACYFVRNWCTNKIKGERGLKDTFLCCPWQSHGEVCAHAGYEEGPAVGQCLANARAGTKAGSCHFDRR